MFFWGDHGWHLGDLRVWGKHTLHEDSLCTSLIVKAPGYKAGVKVHRIVSMVDIYPTLMDLCGISSPDILDGQSLAYLLNVPDSNKWKEVSYSYYNKGISMRIPKYCFSRICGKVKM